MNQTNCVDSCECVYCGHLFNGDDATNYDMSCQSVKCPKCEKHMQVSVSCEFLCTALTDEEQADYDD